MIRDTSSVLAVLFKEAEARDFAELIAKAPSVGIAGPTLVEAASLDGARHPTILLRVIAPLMRPELAAAAILGFAAHWNLVLYPKVMAGKRELWTVQVLLGELLRNRPLDWGLLGAAALVATLPILLLYLLFEEHIVKVFEASFK